MNIVPLLIPDAQPSIAVQPRQRPLHSPAMPTQPFATLDPAPGDPGDDPTLPQGLATERMVVALVGVQLLGSGARSSGLSIAHRRDRVHRRLQHFAVIPVGAGKHGRQGRALPVYDDVMLG